MSIAKKKYKFINKVKQIKILKILYQNLQEKNALNLRKSLI